MLRWVGWLGGCGGFSIPARGVEPYPFGTAIITSVGMLGIDEVPAEWNGELVLRPQVVITATADSPQEPAAHVGTQPRPLAYTDSRICSETQSSSPRWVLPPSR